MTLAMNLQDREPLTPGIPVRPDIRAAILLEAAWEGDIITCEKYGITQRTLQRWRKAMAVDTGLADAVAQKKKAFEERWLEDLDVTLGQAIRTVGVCAKAVQEDPRACKNPVVIHELSVAVKLLADVKLANKVINARLAAMRPQELGGGPEEDETRLLPGEVEIAPGVYVTAADSDVPTPAASADTLAFAEDGS